MSTLTSVLERYVVTERVRGSTTQTSRVPAARYSSTFSLISARVFDGEDPQRSEVMRKGADLLLQRLPTWEEDTGDIDYYYWYYSSYALWQLSGEHWITWQRKMLDSVVAHQRPDGDEKGSWDPEVDPWGNDGGRVYATALNTLTLEVYYRYVRILGAR